ncbi:MAG: hypothetical protein IJI57_11820 [Flexilinea sp.]|nr:hypothetical protein [Flexilinea sp.]
MEKLVVAFLLILMLLAPLAVSADGGGPDPERTVGDDMIEILNNNLDNLFPITSIKEYFNPYHEALYSNDGMETVIEIENDEGKRNIRMFANADSVHDHLAYEFIDEGYLKNFLLTMEVTVRDTWPKGQGGCFVGFTNYGVSAFHGYDGAHVVALVSDAKNMEIYLKNHDLDAGEHFPLETRGKETAKLSIVHLTGHTYVYLDGNYAGQLHDGLEGPFHLLYGTALFTEGDSAACTFDNMMLKRLGSEK